MTDVLVTVDANLGATDPRTAPGGVNLPSMSSAELLRLYDGVLCELLNRGLVRSSNNPVADYAESLTANALGLTLVTKSTTGYDAVGADGTRYEVKARRPTPANQLRQLSVIRGLDEGHFDYLVGILFDTDFRLNRARVIPAQAVKSLARYRQHVNGWVLHLRDNIWSRADVRDVTAELIAAQDSPG